MLHIHYRFSIFFNIIDHKKKIIGNQLNLAYFKNLIKISSGLFWTLYQALNTRTGHQVYIQVFDHTVCPIEKLNSAVAKLADRTSTLSIPNILYTRHYELLEEKPVIEYEFFKGVSLHDFVNNKHILPKTRIQSMWTKIARTLQHVKLLGMSHGCLGPGFILINPNTDQIKLFGFGIQELYKSVCPECSKELVPILPFLPPEAIQPNSIRFNISDNYAFGVMCYFMLTREYPFDSTSVDEILKQKKRPVLPPHKLNSHVSKILSEWTMSLLSYHPEERMSINTLLDYLDPKQDTNVYPDLRKKVFAPHTFLVRITRPFSQFIEKYQIVPIIKQYQKNLFVIITILILFVLGASIIQKMNSESNNQVDATYQEFQRTSFSAEEQPPIIKKNNESLQNAPEKPEQQSFIPDSSRNEEKIQEKQIQNTNSRKLAISAYSKTGEISGRVFIDGTFIGRTMHASPLQVELPETEQIVLTIRSPGYKEWQKRFNVKDMDKTVKAMLAPLSKSHTLYINARELWDSVQINNRDPEPLPTKLELEYGKYMITYYDHASHFKWSDSLQINANSPDSIWVDRSDLGDGQAIFILRNAEKYGYVFITINEQDIKQTTPFKTTLAAGPHKVSFFRKGFTIVPKDTLFIVNRNRTVKISCKIQE